ncbi:MAG TPA: hypothetical protein PKO22_05705 [Treponemataceae bacterium]|nr:hypothetical protein [Treponemataceae bacterium]
MTDEEILLDLAHRFDTVRKKKEIKDTDLVSRGGANGIAMSKFRSGDNITLKTFIRLVRGLGELDRLERLFSATEDWSPTGAGDETPRRRVRDKKKPEKPFTWGDEE